MSARKVVVGKKLLIAWKDSSMPNEEIVVEKCGYNPVSRMFVLTYGRDEVGSLHTRTIPFESVIYLDEFEIIEEEKE